MARRLLRALRNSLPAASATSLIMLTALTNWGPLTPVAQAACTALPTANGTDTMTINAATAGTYRVWTRLMAPDTTHNSVLLQIDQTFCNTSVGGGSAIPANTWAWVNYQNGSSASTIDLNLTAGSHTVTLASNSPGIQVDRLIFTTDTACTPTGTGDNCATLPPTVSLSGVTNGQTVSGGIPVGATVANASGVTKVDFYIDGTLHSTDTTAPYCMAGDNGAICNNLNTTAIANGSHTFTATVAYSGGTISASASVMISNASVPKLGDINNDGQVNIFDLSTMLSNWDTTAANCDLNHDSTVNIFDLSTLLSHWGT